MATNLIDPGQEIYNISLSTLCCEVREMIHEFRSFEKALDKVLRDHNVATAFTREVLLCEIYADIKRDRRRTSIPYSIENLTEYVRVLLHYEVSFEKAMEMLRRQYQIADYSEASKDLAHAIGKALNRRSLGVQVRNRSTYTTPQNFH